MSVSRETKLDLYIRLLQRWGATLNLTSASQRSEPALRALIEDCRCIIPELPPSIGRLIDLGSGQGFPAIPVAIDTGIAVDLIEADRRKAAFLTTALATLGLAGAVYPVRIETATVSPALCVTARALAPLQNLLGLARPLLAPGGTALFLKGPTVSAEVESLDDDPDLRVQIVQTTRPPSTLVKVTVLG